MARMLRAFSAESGAPAPAEDVLERHFRLGGFTHEFQRRRYRWDVALHYVGGMAAGTTSRGLMGSCRINHEVTSILVEDGRAVGVRAHVRKGRGGSDVELRAPLVISDAGAHTTYARLLPDGVADTSGPRSRRRSPRSRA